MTDPYSMLLQMIADGKPDDEIAKVTGWPVDAVATLREEVEYNRRGLAA